MSCMCGAVDCWSCGPAQGYHVHTQECVGPEGTCDCGKLDHDEELAMMEDEQPTYTDEEVQAIMQRLEEQQKREKGLY